MRHPADRFLLIYVAALGAFGVAATFLYAPGGSGIPGLALLVILASVLAGRLLGPAGAVLVSLGLTMVAGIATIWPIGLSGGQAAEFLDLLLLATIAGGCGVYVAVLVGMSEQALAAQRDVTVAARLGVGLVPRALDEDALGRLLQTIQEMICASCSSVFVPAVDGRLQLLPDGRPGVERCGGSVSIADLIREAQSASGAPSGRVVEPVVTASADLYLPITSAAGFEGVLHLGRGPEGGRWLEREIDIAGFAADLIAALIERDRLQSQAAHVEAMEEADALKANILLSISHDLRTPLAAASATIASLVDDADGRCDETAVEDLKAVAEDIASLDWRIGELIDLSRLEAASWRPNIDWNDAGDLCNVVLDSVSDRLVSRLRCELLPDMPPFRFDLVQLGRALHHLVENALLYSPAESPVTIAVSYDDAEVRIVVSDQGPGLTPEERETVFEKFHRGSAGLKVPHGTGLGLAIASNIVSVHGGVIEAENIKPTGARFTIVLPRTREDAQ